ncbi:hypothetical protein [Roseibacillus ishigakijimensis]|uniref:Uncharacterized protein n=1 Tax=Roseibacillus ishigakijimensis TaxID=454146 RepID=A0A934VP37_9BACT|nr:hypothetical protein [Roseibacillus ishigakijimensis]MBK1835685.1 hypothetical protein [Roseibacillus ishigakijimensis]
MKALLTLYILLGIVYAEDSWVPKVNSAKEGDEPAFESRTYPLSELLFDVPKATSGWLPEGAHVESATCKQLGEYRGRKVIQANIALKGRGYSELLLILCSDIDGFKVILASFQDRISQYYEILSAENAGDTFKIKTRYNISGTDPYSSDGSITIGETEGELFLR